MTRYARSSGGTHCRAWECNSGYYNHKIGEKKRSLFRFPNDKDRQVLYYFIYAVKFRIGVFIHILTITHFKQNVLHCYNSCPYVDVQSG